MTTTNWVTQESGRAPTAALFGHIGREDRLPHRALGKRTLDLTLSIAALIVLAPLFALLALLVRLKLGRPIFFRQRRPGLHGQPFTLIKFRTMTEDRDEQGNLLPDQDRVTRFGKLLRSTSLDELPELFNVLKGEMSLVGPRPLLMRYMPYYSERERARFEVLPGLTGMAQINGRNESPWDERFAYDIWYVENQSLLLDLKIMAHTLIKVMRREDVQPVPGSTAIALDEERRGSVMLGTAGAR